MTTGDEAQAPLTGCDIIQIKCQLDLDSGFGPAAIAVPVRVPSVNLSIGTTEKDTIFSEQILSDTSQFGDGLADYRNTDLPRLTG